MLWQRPGLPTTRPPDKIDLPAIRAAVGWGRPVFFWRGLGGRPVFFGGVLGRNLGGRSFFVGGKNSGGGGFWVGALGGP